MSGLSIKRECPDCHGEGWRDDLPEYGEDTTCPTCKGNKQVYVELADATDDELEEAAAQQWSLCADMEWEASGYAHNAQAIEEELKRRAESEATS